MLGGRYLIAFLLDSSGCFLFLFGSGSVRPDKGRPTVAEVAQLMFKLLPFLGEPFLVEPQPSDFNTYIYAPSFLFFCMCVSLSPCPLHSQFSTAFGGKYLCSPLFFQKNIKSRSQSSSSLRLPSWLLLLLPRPEPFFLNFLRCCASSSLLFCFEIA